MSHPSRPLRIDGQWLHVRVSTVSLLYLGGEFHFTFSLFSCRHMICGLSYFSVRSVGSNPNYIQRTLVLREHSHSRSIAATATFFATASLTTRFRHGMLVVPPGDSSLGPHGAAFLVSGFAALTSAVVTSRIIDAKSPARQVVAFCSAFAFSLGLRLSNLTDARRVLGFLLTPAHRAFDPSLVYLAIGAVPLASVLYRVGSVRVQRRGKVDAQLLVGAAVFGIGWGIEGICRKSPSLFTRSCY